MKILKAVELGGLSLILTGVIILFEYNNWPAGSSLSGIALGFSLPAFWKSLQDITDTTNWKTSQRKLKRGDFIKNDTSSAFHLPIFIELSWQQVFTGKKRTRYGKVSASRRCIQTCGK